MITLDYNPKTRAFIVAVPRGSHDVKALMMEHGLDFSTTASVGDKAILFTREPYAAAAFWEGATDAAKAELGYIHREIEASFANDAPACPVWTPPGKELWAFQRADISYALKRKHVLVGDQPGLGKTPIAITFANTIEAKRILVICPAAIRLQWAKRIREWSVMKWPYVVYPILRGQSGVHPTAQWTICSYELARTPEIHRALAAGKYDLLILDEAHYLKTIDSQRTRAIFGGGDTPLPGTPLAECAERIMALTGTPLPNRPREAYTLARALCFDSIDWMSEDSFRSRFNPSVLVERHNPRSGRVSRYIDERTGRHAELQSRLRANFMVRHLKRDVMPQLKLPVYDLIYVEETTAVKAALKAESLLDIDPDNLSGADMAVLGDIATVRRQMGEAMAPQVAEYCRMLLNGGEEKLTLFAWHVGVMDILERELSDFGVLRIDGSTSTPQRSKRVQQFIDEPGQRVMLGNVLSLGTGTDGLQQVCSHALIAEPSWTPGENIQCFDRLDRGGQTRTVQGDIFVAQNSFAEKILATALRKLQTTDKALDRRVASA